MQLLPGRVSSSSTQKGQESGDGAGDREIQTRTMTTRQESERERNLTSYPTLNSDAQNLPVVATPAHLFLLVLHRVPLPASDEKGFPLQLSL